MNMQHGQKTNYAFMTLTRVRILINLPNVRLDSSDDVRFKVL